MEFKDLEFAFCGINVDEKERSITYLVKDNFEDVFNILADDEVKFQHFVDLQNKEFPTGVEISNENEKYPIRFKEYVDFFFLQDFTRPFSLFLSDSKNKQELICTYRGSIKIGREPKN